MKNKFIKVIAAAVCMAICVGAAPAAMAEEEPVVTPLAGDDNLQTEVSVEIPTTSEADTEEIEEVEPEYGVLAFWEIYPISAKKTYMSYKAITNRSSKQYQLQQLAYTDPETGIRMYDGRYMVALGSAFTSNIGQYVDITLENGKTLKCVLADAKSDADTDNTHQYTVYSKCYSEFIVSIPDLPAVVRQRGDVSFEADDWNYEIATITVYDKNALE